MATNSKRNGKKEGQKFPTINRNTLLLGLIALITLLYLDILTQSLGVIGKYFSMLAFKTVGVGAYILPALLLVNLLFILIRKFSRPVAIRFAYIYGLFIAFLMIIEVNTGVGGNLGVRLDHGMDLALIRKGAGIVGTTLGYGLSKYIGVLGVYILSVILLFFSILSFMNMPFFDFAREFLEAGKRLYAIVSSGISKMWTLLQKQLKEREALKEASMQQDIAIENHHQDQKVIREGQALEETPFTFMNHQEYDPNDPNERSDRKDRKDDSTQLTVEDFEVEMPPQKVHYIPPPIHLLRSSPKDSSKEYEKEINTKAEAIKTVLSNFRVEARMIKVTRGPSVACFELEPGPGVKVSSIVGLNDDFALALATRDIRIQAPIPGKSAVGIEVPNRVKDDVFLKDIISSKEYLECESAMPLSLGKDLTGRPVLSKIESMPHLLIAGATGSGKSVCINTIILSTIFRSGPQEVKFILIDPKMVELSIYNGIPHLVVPVVTDPRKASAALGWAVKEMERRYSLFAENMVRDIKTYRAKIAGTDAEDLPYIVIIIDELSDLMMVAAQEVEEQICRLAQMARACGIHLIVATQRPSVDVITGTIKANIPSRISFAVSSQIDSRTILDVSGAEKLLGRGDMLFSHSSFRSMLRLQGAFVSEREVEDIVNYIRDTSTADYDEVAIEEIDRRNHNATRLEDQDELLEKAVDIVISEGQASVSLLQRKLKVGYARAGRLVDTMEELGIIGASEGSKPRRLLVSRNILRDEVIDEYSE